MRWNRWMLAFAGMAVALAGTFVMGCSQSSGSGRGESCRARNDCTDGLRCISNVCVQQDFDIAQSAKSCERVECNVDADCCDDVEPGGTCNRGCENSLCVFRCTMDFECGGGFCMAGRCASCRTDADCGTGNACRQGLCEERCESNADCPYLNTCTAGECIETGCTTNRECVALSDNPRAVCVPDEVSGIRKCLLPCESDAECNPGGYRFQQCDAGRCIYVGCETEEECRIYLDLSPGSELRAVCR